MMGEGERERGWGGQALETHDKCYNIYDVWNRSSGASTCYDFSLCFSVRPHALTTH